MKKYKGMMSKQKGGASVFMLAVYAIVMIFAMLLCVVQLKNIEQLRNDFDTGLLMALLGSAMINTDEYGRSGNRVIHEEYLGKECLGASENLQLPDRYLDEALAYLQKALKQNLNIRQDGSVQETIVVGPVILEEFRVFNVYEKDQEQRICEFIWQEGKWNAKMHPVNAQLYVEGAGERGTAPVLIKDTTLYAKIGFDVAVFPYFSGYVKNGDAKTIRVHVKRSVSIPAN